MNMRADHSVVLAETVIGLKYSRRRGCMVRPAPTTASNSGFFEDVLRCCVTIWLVRRTFRVC